MSVPVMVVLVVGLAIVGWGLTDVFRFSEAEWEASGRRRRDWVWLQILVGPLGTVLYLATARHDVVDPNRFERGLPG